jgi:regulator of sigma E protease
LLLRDKQGVEEWKHVRPLTIRDGWESRSSIGISPAQELKLLDGESPVRKESAAGRASPAFQGGDRVIAVDGQALDEQLELEAYLAHHPDRPIVIRVERAGKDTSPQTLDITVPPQKLRDIGLVMQYGPISAVRPDSPADRAGIQPGDRLVAVQGQPLVDAMLLPAMLQPYYGQEVEIDVERPGQMGPLAVRVLLDPPVSDDWLAPFGFQMASSALGVSYDVYRQVKEVVPQSPAASAGFRPGDVITALEIAWAEVQPGRKPLPSHAELKLDDQQYTWPACFVGIQQVDSDEVLKLTYERAGKSTTVALKPVEIDAFLAERGLHFQYKSQIHQEKHLGQAILLGLRQTREDAFRVVGILRKLITGRVPLANLGGFGSIAYVAGNEANQGTARLLIFLTLLSANLAVLNFLPIPALDGGHMMFLLYEGVFRRPVSERIQFALTFAGVACLLGLMIFVNAMDIKRFIGMF